MLTSHPPRFFPGKGIFPSYYTCRRAGIQALSRFRRRGHYRRGAFCRESAAAGKASLWRDGSGGFSSGLALTREVPRWSSQRRQLSRSRGIQFSQNQEISKKRPRERPEGPLPTEASPAETRSGRPFADPLISPAVPHILPPLTPAFWYEPVQYPEKNSPAALKPLSTENLKTPIFRRVLAKNRPLVRSMLLPK